MRLIKLGLISVVVLFGLLTGIASLLPAHIRISRAIDVEAPGEKLYPPLADIKQWGQWNQFLKVYYRQQCNGDTIRTSGVTVIIDHKSDSLVTAQWIQPTGGHFTSGYRIIARDSLHSSLQWYFDFHLKWYPWEKFQSIVYDQQMGPEMEQSLQHLKQLAEQSH